MMTQAMRTTAVGTVCLALAALGTVAEGRAAPYYEGKTVSLIVGFPAGGGVDAAARVMADFLPGHIEGNPEVIVKNMSGGASIKAQNFVFEKARPDGQTIFFGPWFPVSQIVEAPGIRFRYEEFTMVAAMAAGNAVLYARADLLPGGSKNPRDIVKVDNVKLAGSHPTNIMDVRGRLALELLGVNYTYVRGYRGSAKIRAAVLNGEVDAGGDSVRGYLGAVKPTMVDTGKAIPLWTVPAPDESGNLVRPPEVPEISTVLDVYRDVKGKEPEGTLWNAFKYLVTVFGTASHYYLGPPGMNEEARKALSSGIYATAKDKEYLAAAVKRFKVEPKHAPPERALAAIKSLADIDPDIKAFIQAHVAEGLK